MRCIANWSRTLFVAVIGFVLSACGGNGGYGVPNGVVPANQHARTYQYPPLVHSLGLRSKIQHVIIVVQENRSFNDLFEGFPGATTASYGYDSSSQKVTLNQIGLETTWDLEHDFNGFIAACNGTGSIPGTNCRMNGFNKERAYCYSSCPYPEPMYAYVPHSETKPYFDMGRQYVLADQMYASNLDASSFISHQYIISGQAESAVNFPDGPWGCPGGPGDKISEIGPQRQVPDGSEVVCWDPTTLGDELDNAGISWAFYGVEYSTYSPGIWMAYQAINHIYNGPDWKKDIIGSPSQVLTDITNGNLRSVSWVTPTWTNSDHAGSGSKTGPSWVTSIVNTVGQSKYWDSTAIVVFWDDYGGWYDPEAPAYKDYDGLGLRLPMLIISAYARRDHVSHVHFEHGSILKFVEDIFGLSRLAASDKRATSIEKGNFDFKKPPRTFKVIQAPYDREYFLHQPLDLHPVDTN